MKKEARPKKQTAAKAGAKTKKSIKKIEIKYMPENVPFDEVKPLKQKHKKHSNGTRDLNIEQLW